MDVKNSSLPISPELLKYCYNSSITKMESKVNIVFWVEGVILGIVAVLGIIGNILTIIVLARISLNNVFNQLILALCVTDCFFNVFSLIEYSAKKAFGFISYDTPIYKDLWPKFIYPLHNITFTCSLFITLSVAIERYIAVCHPFLIHHRFQNSQRSVKKRTCQYLLPTILGSILVNVPKFFEFKVKEVSVPEYSKSIFPTNLRLSNMYQVYYINWTRAFFTAFIPFILLILLNGKIVNQIKKADKFISESTNSQKSETKLARILVLLVFSFLICNLGKVVLNIYDIHMLGTIEACSQAQLTFKSPFWVVIMISVNHLLFVMNSSTNLILFSVIGTQFKMTLLTILRLRSVPKQTIRKNYVLNDNPHVKTHFDKNSFKSTYNHSVRTTNIDLC
ncbi:FMRFamide receptor [Lepeophtheirus salmonis]|uniref:FMRFamide receptor n=1 Tax=Lepeophtheirus salmonis TaxID=72036 RepID=UPI001AE96DE0|nr:FMRFamide receptor-like [Lepeophtheirus salmonis]